MIIVQGWVRASADDFERLRAALVENIHATRAEPGCLEYTYAVDFAEPDLLRVLERWTDEAALDAHSRAPHMAVFGQAMADARITATSIKAYAGSEFRTLVER